MQFICAIDKNGGIGRDNKLQWKIPEDMKFFKETTTGKAIIMGSNTFKSIGSKPLPNRENIVISNLYLERNKESKYSPNILRFEHHLSLEEKIKHDDNVFCIGGEKIYNLFFDYFTEGYLTIINKEYNCDTFFPFYKLKDWDNKILLKNKEITIYKYEKKRSF